MPKGFFSHGVFTSLEDRVGEKKKVLKKKAAAAKTKAVPAGKQRKKK